MSFCRMGLGMMLAAALAGGGCCYYGSAEPMPEQPKYAPVWTPRLKLDQKAAQFEESFRLHNRTPEGLVEYERPKAARGPDEPKYGKFSDGPFHTGIALGVFSVKYAATKQRAALADVSKALEGLEMLEKVTGKPGLLARYFSKDPAPFDPKRMHFQDGRRAGGDLADYVYRGDVSKDQYAGAAFGIGACLAHVDDPAIRQRATALARRVATALERDGEQLIGPDGERTEHGELYAFHGPVRVATEAAICLTFAKAAAKDGQGDKYYRDLLARGFGDAVASGTWNLTVFGVRNYVNDNMAFLALYALLALEDDATIKVEYQQGLERAWLDVADDLVPFYDVVYAALGGKNRGKAAQQATAQLKLFPDEKVALPIDWTRDAHLKGTLGQRFTNTRRCAPRADRPLPMNMRAVGSMAWVDDPAAMTGNEGEMGDKWISPLDYLECYWIGRAHGVVGESE